MFFSSNMNLVYSKHVYISLKYCDKILCFAAQKEFQVFSFRPKIKSHVGACKSQVISIVDANKYKVKCKSMLASK